VKIFDTIYKPRNTQNSRSFDFGRKNKKGVALIFTFMVLIAVTSMVVGYLSLVQNSTRNTGNQVSDSQALDLAEAGLHKAIYYLINGNTAPDTSTDGSWRTTAYPADPGAGANDPKQEAFANGTYTMWVEGCSNIRITARGTINGVERIVRQTFTTATWTQIIYDEFETDFGNWTDGGADCDRYTGGTFAFQGDDAVNLQDNTSTSLMSTGDLTLSSYNQVKVDFWYRGQGMDSGDDFWLQISTNGGVDYTTDQTWVSGTDFSNGSFYQECVDLSGYTLTDQTRIRFRVDAFNNGDDVYFDGVRVSASADAVGSLIAVTDTWVEI